MDGNVGPGLMGDFTPFDSTNVSLFKFSSNLPGNTDISGLLEDPVYWFSLATVYKGNIIKNLIMDCQSYTKYRPNETRTPVWPLAPIIPDPAYHDCLKHRDLRYRIWPYD